MYRKTMLIPINKIMEILNPLNIKIQGVLHIGAHLCEELKIYESIGIDKSCIDWIEANPELVQTMKERGVHVHQAAISDIEEDVEFKITNNGESSSLLEFGTHATSYSWCKVVKSIRVQTKTLDSVVRTNNIPILKRNFWNLDIQGVELNALRSAGRFIDSADAIYSEVNTEEVYKKCSLLSEMDAFLESKGFQRKLIAMTDRGWGDALWVRVRPHYS
jgi:FkbM family methyltransferase